MSYILEQNDKALYCKQTKLPFSLPEVLSLYTELYTQFIDAGPMRPVTENSKVAKFQGNNVTFVK